MDWNKLRDKFFKECVSGRTVKETGIVTDYHQWINIAPHDLFEWFKRECEVKETPDELSNCIKPAVSKSALLDEWNDGYNRGCEDTHAAYNDQIG